MTLKHNLRNFPRASKSLLTAAILTLAAASAARAAPPAVLSQLPDDAKAVLVISNVKDLSTKVSNVAVRLNLPAPPDVAGYLTRLAGINKGFDANSSAALVILAGAADAANADGGPPPMVILLPTTDAKTMMQGFQPGEPDKSGISEVTLPNDRAEKGYIATVTSPAGPTWVALAQSQANLEAYLGRKGSLDKTLTADSLKTFEANDLVLWANIPAATKGMDKLLEDKQQELTGMLDLMNVNSNNPDPLMSALQKSAINEYFLLMKQYLSDASTAMVTLRMSDAGPTLGLVGTFKPNTPFAGFLADQKNAKPLSLAGLPNGDFLMAMASSWDPASVSQLAARVTKRVAADEVVSKDPKAKQFTDAMEQYVAALKLITGMEIVVLEPAPNGGTKNGVIAGAYLIDSSDPEKLMNIQLEMARNSIAKDLVPGVTTDVKVTADAVTIKGVKLTRVQTVMTLKEDAADKVAEAAKKQVEMMKKMYGADGATMYFGVVGKHIVAVLGSDQAILEGAVAAAQSGSKDLANSPAIAGAKDNVVPGALGVAYMNLPRLMQAVQGAMFPGGAGAPVGQSAPMVMSAGVTGNTLTMEMHIPTATITAIKDMGSRMMMRGMGGGGGGNGMP